MKTFETRSGDTGVPQLTLTTDDDWASVPAPDGAALALIRHTQPGRFAPNVVVTIIKHAANFQVRSLLDELDQVFDPQAEFAAEPVFEATIANQPFDGRIISFIDPHAGTLVQMHLVTAVPSDDAVHVVQLVGTCAADNAEAELIQVQRVIDSVRVAAHV